MKIFDLTYRFVMSVYWGIVFFNLASVFKMEDIIGAGWIGLAIAISLLLCLILFGYNVSMWIQEIIKLTGKIWKEETE